MIWNFSSDKIIREVILLTKIKGFSSSYILIVTTKKHLSLILDNGPNLGYYFKHSVYQIKSVKQHDFCKNFKLF